MGIEMSSENQSEQVQPSIRRKPLPRVQVIRTSPEGLPKKKAVGFQASLEGDIIPMVDNKPLTSIEREIAEVAMFGNATPQTQEAARRRRQIAKRKDASRR